MTGKLLIICQSTNSDLNHLFQVKKDMACPTLRFSDDPELGLRFEPQPNRMSALLRGTNWWSIAGNLVQIRRLGFTHILFDDASPFYLIYGGLLKLFGLHLVYTLHDQVAHEGRGALAMRLYTFLASRWLANEIIIFSPNQMKTSARINRIWLAGYQGEAFAPTPPPVGPGLRVLLFGRVKKYKGYEHLARIAANTIGLPIHYRVVGQGEAALLAPLCNCPNVTVEHRHVEDAEVPVLFAEADVNLLPYNSATQSGVALLAASFGVPTLAFDVGDLKSYLDLGIGKSLPAGNNDVMAVALSQAASMSAQERINVRLQTRAAYDRHFSAQSLRQSYAELHRRLTGRGAS